jgi:hypothetical protein
MTLVRRPAEVDDDPDLPWRRRPWSPAAREAADGWSSAPLR